MESTQFAIKKDGEEFRPPIIEDLNLSAIAQKEKVTDLCGNTENRKISSGSWQLDVDGVMLGPDKDLLKSMHLKDEEAQIIADIHSGVFTIDTVDISQTDSENTGTFPNRTPSKATLEHADERANVYEGLVYTFKIQTQDPTSSSASKHRLPTKIFDDND